MKKNPFFCVWCALFIFAITGCQSDSSLREQGKPPSPKFIVIKDPGFFDLLFQSEAVNSYCKQEILNFDPNYHLYDKSVFDAVKNADTIKIVSGTYETNREVAAHDWLRKYGAKGKIEYWTGQRCDGPCTPTRCCPIKICFEYNN